MTFYSRLAALTLKQLTKFGQSVILRPYSVGGFDYDSTTGAAIPIGADGSLDETRKALTTDQPGNQIALRFGMTLEKNTLVQKSDKWLYLDANGRAPDLQDHIIFGGVNYSIVNSQECSPGGVPVFYLIVCRA